MPDRATAAMQAALAPEVLDVNIELLERRQRVLQLHHANMPQTQIAAALKIDQPTVSRDLAWMRKHWRAVYGVPGALSPAEEIGGAIAFFDDVQGRAMREAANTINNPRAKMACFRTALMARGMRLMLLQDVGILDRAVGTLTVTAVKADDIRSMLRAEGIPIGREQRQLGGAPSLDEDEDEARVVEWLKRGEA